MKYLITGGAGFIGSTLAAKLITEGHQVKIFDNMSRGKLERVRGLGCDVIRHDVRDLDVMRWAVHGMDSVIHLAYLQGTQTFYANPREVLDVAVRGMTNVLEACRCAGTGELMLVSSSEAYQIPPEGMVPTPEEVPLSVPDGLNPRYSYGAGKIISEVMANAWQRDGVLDRVMIVRPHNIYGPDMGREHVIPEFCIKMNSMVTDGEWLNQHGGQPFPFPIQGTGQETRSFCFIDDCIAQLTAILAGAPQAGTEVYHVGNPELTDILTLAQQIARCYGEEINVVPGALPKGSPPARQPDVSKVVALAGQPRVPLVKGLPVTVEWYRDNG